MMEKGRVVIKLNGRFAGYPAVILDKIDDNFVKIGIVLNSIIKEKKSNIKHVLPLPYKVKDTSLTKQRI